MEFIKIFNLKSLSQTSTLNRASTFTPIKIFQIFLILNITKMSEFEMKNYSILKVLKTITLCSSIILTVIIKKTNVF